MFNRLKRAYQNVRPYVFNGENAPAIGGSLLLTGVGVLTSIGSSYTFSQAVNSLYSGEAVAMMGIEFSPYGAILVSGAMFTANNIIARLREWILTPLGPKIAKEIVVDHIEELMMKDLAFHQTTPFGSHVTRFDKCFSVGNAVSTQLFATIIPPMLDMGTAVVLLSNYGADIGPVLGGVVVAYIGSNLIVRNKMVESAEDAQKKGFKSFEVAMQEIKEYKTVHDFNNLPVSMKKVNDSLSTAIKAQIKSLVLIPKAGVIQAVISGGGYTGVCLSVGRRVLSQQLTAGDYALVASLAGSILLPLDRMATGINQVITAIPNTEMIFEDFKNIPRAKDDFPDVKLDVDPTNATIELENIKFNYDGGLTLLSLDKDKEIDSDVFEEAKNNYRPILINRNGKFSFYCNQDKNWQERSPELSPDEINHLKTLFEKSASTGINVVTRAELEGTLAGTILKRVHNQVKTVLNNVSCIIEPGKKIGIVGTTGGGKSTLLLLLLRYYDLLSGRILINGQDISKVSLRSLRSAIGIVPQTTTLFNDTLYNNIAYGGLSRPGGVSKADVEAAVDAACLRDFVNSLPDGLNTMVGEGGAKLSGGQRQRIAIARVILRNPSIVVLDEATSALDSETEAEIQANLDTAFQGKTQLVVAHRLGTIKNSDRILVFDQGNIVESGTHDQLIASENGVYANLYKPKNAPKNEVANSHAEVEDSSVVFHFNDESSIKVELPEVKQEQCSAFYNNATAPRGYRPTVFKPTHLAASSTPSMPNNGSRDEHDSAIELQNITIVK